MLALAGSPILLNVDATEVDRGVIRVQETLPTSSGKRAFYFPKFIPGEHRASGPINYLFDLHFYANGKELEWNRDGAELFKFIVDVPSGVDNIEAKFAMTSEFRQPVQPGQTAPARGTTIPEGLDNVTPNLARIKWNRLLLYPAGSPTDKIMIQPKLTPPAGWSVATALEPGAVSVTELVDSPAVVGKYFKSYEVGNIAGAPIYLDVMSEEAGFQNVPESSLAGVKELVRQQGLLFGGRHFRKYHFLVTLSNAGAGEGLEHHESSEDGTGLQSGVSGSWGELFAHEMTHSWNGKFRRPEGLATPDFHKPMDGSGLWVYEGLTQYLGYVQAARAGLMTPERFRSTWSGLASNFSTQAGRSWRPVVDTGRSVGLLRNSGGSWNNERRGTDYYTEGALVWLEADCIIREGTKGKKSLNDFIKIFYGGVTDKPFVKPYGTGEIVKDLKKVYPYDWASYLHERIDLVHLNTPAEALEKAGYKLLPGSAGGGGGFRGGRGGFGGTSLPMLGLTVSSTGGVSGVALDGPALKAGLRLGLTIAKVDGKPFDSAALTTTATTPGPGSVSLELSNGQTIVVPFTGGPLGFHIEPIEGKPDMLAAIAKSL